MPINLLLSGRGAVILAQPDRAQRRHGFKARVGARVFVGGDGHSPSTCLARMLC